MEGSISAILKAHRQRLESALSDVRNFRETKRLTSQQRTDLTLLETIITYTLDTHAYLNVILAYCNMLANKVTLSEEDKNSLEKQIEALKKQMEWWDKIMGKLAKALGYGKSAEETPRPPSEEAKKTVS